MLGESTELNAAQDRLNLFGIAAAIAIFLLLQAAFGSLRLAPLTFLLLPMALVGGVLAVKIGDGILSLGSLVGFLTVFGIAARNGILMVSHFQHLEQEEGVPFGPALVLRGAKERLAPIMMTALATGLALVPLAVAGEHPGSRDRAPDGDRDPRRPGHVDAAEPVRPPVALPALRQVPPRACGSDRGCPDGRPRGGDGHDLATNAAASWTVAAAPLGRLVVVDGRAACVTGSGAVLALLHAQPPQR